MDFLTSALYSEAPDGESKLAGALLTRFDPDDLLSRAQVFYASVEDLRKEDKFKPSGFKLTGDGVLLSDTQARADMSSTMAAYVAYELGNSSVKAPTGLLDVVLYAAKFGGRVVPVRIDEISSQEDAVSISMQSFSVSKSSFNIYAPYKRGNEFRTFSLIDIETDKNIPFVLAIPDVEVENCSPVASWLEPLAASEFFPEHQLFRVDAPFLAFHTLTGEGFLNYLAYNVASCDIGLQVMESFMSDTKYRPDLMDKEERSPRIPKKPLHNVAIECTCRRPHVQSILNCLKLDDMDRLKELVKDEECFITFAWLRHIFAASERFEGEDIDSKTAAACASLQRECKAQRLHFAVELLAQRFHICNLGFIQDPYGPVLRGGGVNGCGVKRFTRGG